MLKFINPTADVKISLGADKTVNLQFKDKNALGYSSFRPSFNDGKLFFTPVPEDVGKKLDEDGFVSFVADTNTQGAYFVEFIGEYTKVWDAEYNRWYVSKDTQVKMSLSVDAAPVETAPAEEKREETPSAQTESADMTEAHSEYRSYKELLTADPAHMTEKEAYRLARIKAIPETVRNLTENEIDRLTAEIWDLERRRDALVDYLNGEGEGA